MEEFIGNIPVMGVDKAIKTLSMMYANVINKNINLNTMPSVMLWGQPGVGKSQAIRELADELKYLTKKEVNVTDVRLLLFNPVDLRGIPTANADKTLAIWLKPKVFDMDSSSDVINILLLDEISAAPQSVQAAAYQITLDKTVGEHKLPNNCIVIAAGNRLTDKSVAYQMPKALANRLLHIEIEANYESWNRWAIRNNIHKYVLGFLKFKPHYLNNFNPKSIELSFATPRSWEMVSNILNNVSENIDDVYDLISGLIGKGLAVEFRTWLKLFNKLPSIEDIFNGKDVDAPKEMDVTYALISSMVSYAKMNKDNLDLIENSVNFAKKLTPDFSLVLLKDYMYIEKNYLEKLLTIPSYAQWARTKGRLLDAANGI